jgi:methenyltetrahydromethanopterin cyclohydrolase
MESLNQRGAALCLRVQQQADRMGVGRQSVDPDNTILDFGVEAEGSLEAGLRLAEICWSDLGTVASSSLDAGGRSWPIVRVATSEPLRACMASQYAGWRIHAGEYVAMCSGPIRAAYAGEPFFEAYPVHEKSETVVGVLEASLLPGKDVFAWIRSHLPESVHRVILCVAGTDSLAGRIQIVARSVESACHKLHELGFDLTTIRSGAGTSPLPPSAGSHHKAMGATNDAILLAAQVTLEIDASDQTLAEIGPRIPSCSSPQFGRPFLEIFEEAQFDFYRIDRALFAPAEVTLQSTRTGHRQTFGGARWDLYAQAVGAA